MIISQTPLRISLAGGGTDLPSYCERRDGKVLSCAIDKYVYVIVQQRFDDWIHVNYARRKEVVRTIHQVKHELVRNALLLSGMKCGFEVTTLADIPSEGSGLGSSSSFTVGLLNAFHAFLGKQVDPELLARQACEIELERLRKPIGRQDQYIAAYGGVRFFTFRKSGAVRVEDVKAPPAALRELEAAILLYYTGKTRSADPLLRSQSRRARANRAALDEIRELAVAGRAALETGEVDAIGHNLHANWELKKRLAEGISVPEIEAFYEKARNHGALGGKVTGAGGAGFFLLYAPPNRRADLRAALTDWRELPVTLEPDGSKIIFNIKRRIWK